MISFRDALIGRRIAFCYCGFVTDALISTLSDTIRFDLARLEADRRTMRNVFAVLVEDLQNVMRYSADAADSAEISSRTRHGLLAIGRDDDHDGVFIACGNLIRRDDVPDLRARLAQIQGLAPDELRALAMRTLRGEGETAGGGAGLGFIEIQRRARRPIEFEFVETDGAYCFFGLTVTV